MITSSDPKELALLIVVQSPSHVQLSVTPWTATCQTSLSFTVSWSLPRFITNESVMLSNRLVLCCPFSFCLQSFPASGSFLISQLFASGGQSIVASAIASVLPINIQGWFPLGLTCLIALLSKGLSRVFSSTTIQKHQFFGLAFFMVQLSHLYMTTGKPIALLYGPLSVKWRLWFVIRCLGLSLVSFRGASVF